MITPGRIVLYRLSAFDVETVRYQRNVVRKPDGYWPKGNPVDVGQAVPLLVARVWPSEYGNEPGVNGQAFLDGNDSLWICSAKEGNEPGQWQWPERVSQ